MFSIWQRLSPLVSVCPKGTENVFAKTTATRRFSVSRRVVANLNTASESAFLMLERVPASKPATKHHVMGTENVFAKTTATRRFNVLRRVVANLTTTSESAYLMLERVPA